METAVASVTPRQAYAGSLRRAARLVDVRDRDEWVRARIPGATNIPLGELPEQLEQLERLPCIAFVCAEGRRSAVAADLLAQRGRVAAISVQGGLRAWGEAGLPLCGTDFDREGSP